MLISNVIRTAYLFSNAFRVVTGRLCVRLGTECLLNLAKRPDIFHCHFVSSLFSAEPGIINFVTAIGAIMTIRLRDARNQNMQIYLLKLTESHLDCVENDLLVDLKIREGVQNYVFRARFVLMAISIEQGSVHNKLIVGIEDDLN